MSAPTIAPPVPLCSIPLPAWADEWDAPSGGERDVACANRYAVNRSTGEVTFNTHLMRQLVIVDVDRVDRGSAPFALAWAEPIFLTGVDVSGSRSLPDFALTMAQARDGVALHAPRVMTPAEVALVQQQVDYLLAAYDCADVTGGAA